MVRSSVTQGRRQAEERVKYVLIRHTTAFPHISHIALQHPSSASPGLVAPLCSTILFLDRVIIGAPHRSCEVDKVMVFLLNIRTEARQ
jgi:hypothetical protein